MKKMSIGAVLIAIFCLFEANFTTGVEKIDINTAPLEDLVQIVHIGETRARELISLRPFTSVDDLIRIKGIGETRIKDIKQQGLAWVDPLLNIGGEASNILEAEPQMKEAEPQVKEAQAKEVKPQSNSELAAVEQPIRQAQGKQVSVLLALVIAVFSGATILILKKRLK